MLTIRYKTETSSIAVGFYELPHFDNRIEKIASYMVERRFSEALACAEELYQTLIALKTEFAEKWRKSFEAIRGSKQLFIAV